MSHKTDVTLMTSLPPKMFPEAARRAEACLFACSGIPTEALERGTLADALRALAVLLDDGEPAACQRLARSSRKAILRALGWKPAREIAP